MRYVVTGLTALAVLAVSITAVPECAYEDSTNCVWDAGDRGNGKGRSFIDIGGLTLYTGGSHE